MQVAAQIRARAGLPVGAPTKALLPLVRVLSGLRIQCGAVPKVNRKQERRNPQVVDLLSGHRQGHLVALLFLKRFVHRFLLDSRRQITIYRFRKRRPPLLHSLLLLHLQMVKMEEEER